MYPVPCRLGCLFGAAARGDERDGNAATHRLRDRERRRLSHWPRGRGRRAVAGAVIGARRGRGCCSKPIPASPVERAWHFPGSGEVQQPRQPAGFTDRPQSGLVTGRHAGLAWHHLLDDVLDPPDLRRRCFDPLTGDRQHDASDLSGMQPFRSPFRSSRNCNPAATSAAKQCVVTSAPGQREPCDRLCSQTLCL